MCGSEAIGIIGESTLACLAAKHECGSGPGCLGCNVAGMEEHTAHGVGFEGGAIGKCLGDEIIAFTIEDRAAVRTDVQRRELWLGVDEAVYRQAERDGVWGLGEHQHERITDLFEDPASVSRCAAATVPLNLRKTSAAA